MTARINPLLSSDANSIVARMIQLMVSKLTLATIVRFTRLVAAMSIIGLSWVSLPTELLGVSVVRVLPAWRPGFGSAAIGTTVMRPTKLMQRLQLSDLSLSTLLLTVGFAELNFHRHAEDI